MGKIILGHLGALLVLTLAAQGGAMENGRPQTTVISGTVRLVGNAPFARLVLTPEDAGRNSREGDWLLLGPLREELRKGYQGKQVTLEGTPCPSPTPQFSKCFEPSRILGR